MTTQINVAPETDVANGGALEDVLDRQAVSISELRALLIEQRRLLVQQSRAIELLDQRRDEIEELIEVFVPIGNAALSKAIQKLDALEKSGLPAGGRDAIESVRKTMAAPAPGLRQLWHRLRAPQARRGVAVILDFVETLGRGISSEQR